MSDLGHAADTTNLGLRSKLNWLRAGVLGANDGIVSTAGLVVGVAGATRADPRALLIAGLAGLVAGSLSMAGGEYVSVSAQRDTEEASLAKERKELAEMPEEELAELAGIYRAKGMSAELAARVAEELTAHDALAAHAEAELGFHPEERTNPWHAAFASMLAFAIGGVIPVLAIVFAPEALKVSLTVGSVVFALILTGFISAKLGGSGTIAAIARNVIVGLLAMGLTYWVGHFVGVSAG